MVSDKPTMQTRKIPSPLGTGPEHVYTTSFRKYGKIVTINEGHLTVAPGPKSTQRKLVLKLYRLVLKRYRDAPSNDIKQLVATTVELKNTDGIG
ncbi:hypothetical protein GWI33_023076 [Rhynchophorus ferrugineus]|uniref:Uncharacterized protein n=1 Tax=Rhynchophorus ferrugineus TaxID=354439 RepID=A0A834LZ52_RHYFE|nr:hypothetical protein GWI33_023081 [Rhynchophorus ferrugineus]KAF7264538.1 hypothetical protein GWI33_023076 [Rhynchophorus ferrugineus]